MATETDRKLSRLAIAVLVIFLALFSVYNVLS